MMGVTLRHLQCFVTIAEVRHFGRTAARLDMAQPLFSQMMLRLERALGGPLLVRRPRVVLTPAGERFLPFATRALAELELGASRTAMELAGKMGRLRIGFPTWLSLTGLAEVIAGYQLGYPAVEVTFVDLPTVAQIEGLRSGVLDVAFVRETRDPGCDLVSTPFLEEPLVLALPVGHPLVATPTLRAADLANAPFVMVPRHAAPELFDLIVSNARARGLAVRIVQEAQEWLTVLGLVAVGTGLAFVPRSMAQIGLPRVGYSAVEDMPMMTTLSVVRRGGDPDPVVDRFLDALLTPGIGG